MKLTGEQARELMNDRAEGLSLLYGETLATSLAGGTWNRLIFEDDETGQMYSASLFVSDDPNLNECVPIVTKLTAVQKSLHHARYHISRALEVIEKTDQALHIATGRHHMAYAFDELTLRSEK